VVTNSAFTQAQIDAMFAGGSIGAAASHGDADDKKADATDDDKKKAAALAHTGSDAGLPAMLGLALVGAGAIAMGVRRRSMFVD